MSAEQQFGYLGALIAVVVILARYILNRRKAPAAFDLLDGLEMNFRQKLALRLRILETNYGRDGGWFVEDNGRRVALLTEPCFADMFWESYRITVLSEFPDERECILNSDAFWRERQLVYKSRSFGLEANFAFSSGLSGPGRVVMRGLYLPVRYSFLERPLLWLRRRCSARQPK